MEALHRIRGRRPRKAFGQVYVEKYFSPGAKQEALKMVKEIEAAMEQDINSLPWMSARPSSRRW